MKTKTILFGTALFCVAATSLIGCGKSKESGGSNVIQVKMYDGGHGRAWFDQIARKFEAMEAAKGNVVSVKLDNRDYSKLITETAVSEIEVPQENVYDLYFLNGADVNKLIRESYDILGTDEVTLLRSMDDILNSKAIKFDGTEESVTIKSRLFSGYEKALTYHNDVPSNQDKWDGEIFQLPWADCMTGIVCNKSMLDILNLDIPLTSNQFLDVVKSIYNDSISASSKLNGAVPFTFAGKDCPGYWGYLWNTWFAQYAGYEGYQNFLSCMPDSGDIEHEGYKVYENPGIEKALEPMFEILDTKYCTKNAGSANYAAAQYNFGSKEAVFMINGDWMANEIGMSVPSLVANVKNSVMIKTPVLSCLGTEIGLSTDEELAQLVKLIDEKKSDQEIITAMSGKVDVNGIDRIRKARTVHHSEGPNHVALIPSYADAADYAAEFLRFLYSNDACNLYSQITCANLPFTYTPDAGRQFCPFEQSLIDIYNYDTVTTICENALLNEIRKTSGMRIFNNTAWNSPQTYLSILNSKTAQGWTAKSLAQAEAQTVKTQWGAWMGSFNW